MPSGLLAWKQISASLVGVLLCCAADAQNPLTAYPNNYRLAFDNSAVSVIRVHYGPHEKVGVHDHSGYPTVYVYLSDSPPVRFQHDEKPPFAVTRPPAKAGAFRVSPGRVERHTVENLGDASSDVLRIELKQVPLGGVRAFRGEAPLSLSVRKDDIEFKSPALEVERVVCVAAMECGLPASATPSLLVAFTPFSLVTAMEGMPGTRRGAGIVDGQVRWLAVSEGGQVLPETGVPAHLVRIYFGSPGTEPPQERPPGSATRAK